MFKKLGSSINIPTIVLLVKLFRFFDQEWVHGPQVCLLWIFADTVVCTVSIWTLVAIAADRMIVIIIIFFFLQKVHYVINILRWEWVPRGLSNLYLKVFLKFILRGPVLSPSYHPHPQDSPFWFVQLTSLHFIRSLEAGFFRRSTSM